MNYDHLLQPSVTKLTERDLATVRDLQEKGLIKEIVKREYIRCVSPDDDDYFESKERGCNETIEVTDEDQAYISCPGCSRDIELRLKNSFSRWTIKRDDDGVYRYIRDEFRDRLNGSASKISNGVRYLDQRIEPAFNIAYDGSSVRVIVVFEYKSTEVLDAIQIFDLPTVVVLVGNAAPQAGRYRERNIPYIKISGLIEQKSGSSDCRSVFSSALEGQTPSNRLAEKGISLYNQHRQRYTWREFEHTVQHCLSTCFETSRLLGGQESGEQVPEGVLSLDYEVESSAYIWDAKYVNDPDDSRSLSGEYENMAKHLVNFRRESNVKDVYGDITGFLVISPGITGSSIVRLAERIQQRIAENGEEWNGAVTHVRFDSLVHLFESVVSNRDKVDSKPREFRKHVDRLFTRSNYHNQDPEEYTKSDQRVFDVSASDVDAIFDEYLTHQGPEDTEINIEGYLANIRSLDY